MSGSTPAGPIGDPRLQRIWPAAHRRLERRPPDAPLGTLVLPSAHDEERTAVDLLLGTRAAARALRIDLARLDEVLVATCGEGLVDVVGRVVGPVRDRAGERHAAARAVEELFEALRRHPALSRYPALAAWLDALRAAGSWRRLEDPAALLPRTLDVLVALPLGAQAGRSRFAAELLGDAHALDDGRPLARLVLSAIPRDLAERGAAPATGADERRRRWHSVGVASDESSSTVLVLGLRPEPDGPLTDGARRWADGAVPLPIPLAALRSEAWRLPEGTVVHCCENPSVIEGARALGSGCPPLMCVEGQPSLAALALLDSLVEAGRRVRYHGDFGGGGIAIANAVLRRTRGEPWRFRAADHAEALARATAAGLSLRPLRGSVEEAEWDPALAAAVRAAGVEVEEELSLDLLVSDLRRHSALLVGSEE